MPPVALESYLASFPLDPVLHGHVAAVFAALPAHVLSDFVTDPGFSLCDYEPTLLAAHIRVASPGVRRPSRAVVLKRTLRRRPEGFIRWVIAHELAHAHL